MATLDDVQTALQVLTDSVRAMVNAKPSVSLPVTAVGAVPPAQVVATSEDLDQIVATITSLANAVNPPPPVTPELPVITDPAVAETPVVVKNFPPTSLSLEVAQAGVDSTG